MTRAPDLETVNRTLSVTVQKLQAELAAADAKVRHLMQTHDDMADDIERLRAALLAITPFAEWQLNEMTAERNPRPLKNALKIARAALAGKEGE